VDATAAGPSGRVDLLGVVFADLEHITRRDGVETVTADSLASAGPAGATDPVFSAGL
jgi:hypothetical protein